MRLIRWTGSIATAAGSYLLAAAIAGTSAWAEEAPTFSKIANDGAVVTYDTPFGAEADDWACSREDATGLVWEVKTADGGLRDRRWTYTPYDSNPETNGGWEGYRDSKSGTCIRALMDENSCNTEAYVKAVNRAKLCGFSDWRLPVLSELVKIAERTSRSEPATTSKPLPNTADGWYWTGVERVGVTAFSRVVLLPTRGRPHFYKGGSYMVVVVRNASRD